MLILNDLTTLAWVANMAEADPRIASASIGWLRDDEHTCGVFYENYTGSCITATIAVAPGAVFPKEFLKAIFKYPFKQLGCKKMLALVAGNNWKSIELVTRMGFVAEAEIVDYYPDASMIVYGITPEQCRYLEKDNG